jgi:hypothetical protein
MARSTGPIIATGTIAWANNLLIDDQTQDDIFTESIRMVLVTGLAGAFLYGVEKVSEDLAVALAWASVITVLFVRTKADAPTPLERIIDLLEVGRPEKR